jgi:hypothetical protein
MDPDGTKMMVQIRCIRCTHGDPILIMALSVHRAGALTIAGCNPQGFRDRDKPLFRLAAHALFRCEFRAPDLAPSKAPNWIYPAEPGAHYIEKNENPLANVESNFHATDDRNTAGIFRRVERA